MRNCKKYRYLLSHIRKSRKRLGANLSMDSNAKVILALALAATMLLSACGGPIDNNNPQGGALEAVAIGGGYTSEPSREKFTKLRGDGEDIVTIMLYLVGSDLESESGCATYDLLEILDADIGDQINFVIQTGGALEWQNELIDSSVCERYIVSDGDLEYLGDVGNVSMAQEKTLKDFISFSAENFPADRYQLVFWNHGGGTMGGFGYDENFGDMLSLTDIDRALDGAGIKFDLVGFDACLMATVETAVMLEPYADYLIASEELEPGDGWYYTDFLTSLGRNTSIDTVKLGRQIIDDFVDYYSWSTETTLSIIDLTEISGVSARLNEFLNTSGRLMIENSDYKTFSNARAGARSYGNGDWEQIDIADFVIQTGLSEGDELINTIKSAVKYRAGSVSDSYGLAMYFPYEEPDYYEHVSYMLDEIGMGDEYTSFFDQFLSILAGGQTGFASALAPPLNEIIANMEQEDPDYEAYGWFEESVVEDYDYGHSFDYNELEIFEKHDGYVLQMTDDEWGQIVGIELQVWFDDGEGYIDLGSDSLYDFDDDGDLMISYDNLWVSINGQIVSFYTEKEQNLGDGRWYSYGYVPCFVNDIERELVLAWNNEQESGYVAGYRSVSVTGGHAAKGITPLSIGDAVDFIADYYTYDGEYDDWYYIGDTIVYDGTEWEISYEDIGENSCLVFYMLTDIYQNTYYTEALEFYTP